MLLQRNSTQPGNLTIDMYILPIYLKVLITQRVRFSLFVYLYGFPIAHPARIPFLPFILSFISSIVLPHLLSPVSVGERGWEKEVRGTLFLNPQAATTELCFSFLVSRFSTSLPRHIYRPIYELMPSIIVCGTPHSRAIVDQCAATSQT